MLQFTKTGIHGFLRCPDSVRGFLGPGYVGGFRSETVELAGLTVKPELVRSYTPEEEGVDEDVVLLEILCDNRNTLGN